MELVVALSIIFSVVALFTAIYTVEELMKLRNRIEGILDNYDKIIRYIDIRECYTKKED